MHLLIHQVTSTKQKHNVAYANMNNAKSAQVVLCRTGWPLALLLTVKSKSRPSYVV